LVLVLNAVTPQLRPGTEPFIFITFQILVDTTQACFKSGIG